MERLTVRNSEGIGVLKQPFQCERCGDLQWSLPDLGEGSPTDRLAEYEDIGLLPEQIKEIDKLYTEKCSEVAQLQKELKRYRNLEEKCIKENYVGIEIMLKKFAEFEAEIHELYEYKQLKKEGKLLKLLCAVGDTYFEIETEFWRDREKCKRCGFYHEGSDVFRDDDSCFFEDEYNKLPGCVEIAVKTFNDAKEIISCMEDGSVGKTIFFVREEAEAALKSQESRNKV